VAGFFILTTAPGSPSPSTLSVPPTPTKFALSRIFDERLIFPDDLLLVDGSPDLPTLLPPPLPPNTSLLCCHFLLLLSLELTTTAALRPRREMCRGGTRGSSPVCPAVLAPTQLLTLEGPVVPACPPADPPNSLPPAIELERPSVFLAVGTFTNETSTL